MDTSKVTRFEVIDHVSDGGRILVRRLSPDAEVILSLQDDGRTLKVFLRSTLCSHPHGFPAPLGDKPDV